MSHELTKRALGLYVHVPFCASKCRYCGFYSEVVETVHEETGVRRQEIGGRAKSEYRNPKSETISNNRIANVQDEEAIHLEDSVAATRTGKGQGRVGAVIDAMAREMQEYDLSGVDTIYVGGGSPSSIPEGELVRLLEHIRSSATLPAREEKSFSTLPFDLAQGEAQRRATTEERARHASPLQDKHAGGVRYVEEKNAQAGSSSYPEMEFTVEVNPGQVTVEKLRKMREMGVNRLSMGAQSFDDGELAFLGRRHKAADVIKSVAAARKAGFSNISIDLIFAIPGQSMESWQRTLAIATSLGAEHISAYALTYEKGTPLYAARERGEVVAADEELDRAMYLVAIDTLAAAGYQQYEISNFAKAGFECRHNHKYWANDEYVGIGPGAASWYGGARWGNEASIERYVEAMGRKSENRNPKLETISNDENSNGQNEETGEACLAPTRRREGRGVRVEEHRPNTKEIACETAVLNLRRLRGIGLKEYMKRTGFDAMELFGDVISRYETVGMLKVEDGRVFLTREALPVADSVLCDFASTE